MLDFDPKKMKKCKQCGAVRPLSEFRKYYGLSSHCNTCKVCEKYNGRLRYLQKKIDSGVQLTEQEQDNYDKINEWLSLLEENGFSVPKKHDGLGRGARMGDYNSLNLMIDMMRRGNAGAPGDVVTTAIMEQDEAEAERIGVDDVSTDIAQSIETAKANVQRQEEQEKATSAHNARAAMAVMSNELDMRQSMLAAEARFAERDDAQRTSAAAPQRHSAAASQSFVDKTKMDVLTRETYIPVETPTLTSTSIPSKDDLREYEAAIAAGDYGRIAGVEQAKADIEMWLTCELTEEPDYYMDEVYDRLRDKYMPVIMGSKGSFDEKRANVELKPLFDKLLERFEDYEDEYWETH